MEDFPANVTQLPNRNLLKMDVQSCLSTEIISQLRKLAKAIFSKRKMQQVPGYYIQHVSKGDFITLWHLSFYN